MTDVILDLSKYKQQKNYPANLILIKKENKKNHQNIMKMKENDIFILDNGAYSGKIGSSTLTTEPK